MAHQASGGESCQRLFFSGHRTPEPCLKKSDLVSCTPQRSEKPTKTRANRTFRVDYHPHALQKSLYSFRHSFAQRKLLEGVDPITVATLLGHSNLSMLANQYSHLMKNPEHLLKAVNSNPGA